MVCPMLSFSLLFLPELDKVFISKHHGILELSLTKHMKFCTLLRSRDRILEYLVSCLVVYTALL